MTLVALCPIESIDGIWGEVKCMLDKAVSYSGGRQEIDDVYWQIASERAQLWAISVDGKIVAAAVSELRDYGAKRLLNVLFVGGTQLDRWVAALIEKLKRFAAFNMADGIEMTGRPGWLKVLAKHGFSKSPSVLMELSLSGK